MALQMTWQPHLHRRKSGPPLGLKNLGNSCYLNSVLQCLTYTPPLANFCLRNQHSSLCGSASGTADCPFCILERRIVRSLSIDVPLDAPSKIHTSLRIFAKHFRWGHQEDAHEFLRYVIDACHNTCVKLVKERKVRNGITAVANGMDSAYCHETVVKEIFGGALQSEVKCLSCGAESRKTDEIMDISLDVFQSSSLKDALRRFFQSEVLDGGNKYNCEKCKKLSAARKQMFVLRAPNILVIQLKRFEGIFGLKIDRAISFEEVLTLSSYMCKASQDPQPEYNLFGTIVHSGYSPESGHYYAYIKDATGRWYCCNDSYVTVSTLQEVLSEKVYILFFSRTNQRPRPTKTAFPHNAKKSSPVSNGNAVSVNPKETAPLRPPPTKLNGAPPPTKLNGAPPPTKLNGAPPPTKPNGAHHSRKDTPVISKIDKMPSNSGMKFSLKRPGSKGIDANGNGNVKVHNNASIMNANGNGNVKVHNNASIMNANGNGNVKVHNNSSIMKHGDSEESTGNETVKMSSTSKSTEESRITGKQQMQSISNGNCSDGSKSSAAADCNGKQTLLPVQNIAVDLQKAVHMENGTGNAAVDGESVSDHVNAAVGRESDHVSCNGNDEHSSGIPGCKRKSLDSEKIEAAPMESSNMSGLDASSVAKLAKFKEMLAREATSDLHSCGWVNEVQSFMHARKKICTESTGNAPNTTELKKLLIADAKKTFTSQLPESLKEYLIGRLRSFSQGKETMDT